MSLHVLEINCHPLLALDKTELTQGQLLSCSNHALIDLKKRLSKHIPLGLSLSSLSDFVSERWELYGDGRKKLEPLASFLIAKEICEKNPSDLDRLGSQRLLIRLAQDISAFLDEDLSLYSDLSDKELALLNLIQPYRARVEELGFILKSDIYRLLAARMQAACTRPVYLFNALNLKKAERYFLLELSRYTEVYVLLDCKKQPIEKKLSETLQREAEEAGVTFSSEMCDGERLGLELFDEQEMALQEFGAALYRQQLEGDFSQNFSLLVAAGPLSEAELLAREIVRQKETGAKRIALAAPKEEIAGLWEKLTSRLYDQQIALSAEFALPSFSSVQLKAFIAYVRAVAELQEVDANWPTDGRLGDMSWWPAQDILHFLRSDLAGLSHEKLLSLERSWWHNRLLKPAEVLNALLSGRKCTNAVAEATRELLAGKIGSAALILNAAAQLRFELKGGDFARNRAELTAAMNLLIATANELKDFPTTAELSLVKAAELLEDYLSFLSTVTPLELRPEAASAELEILPLERLAEASPASYDAVIFSHQTNAQASVAKPEDLYSVLLELTHMEPSSDRLALRRAEFWRACRAAKSAIALELAETDEEGDPAFESALMLDYLACFGASSLKEARKTSLAFAYLDEFGLNKTVQQLALQPAELEDLRSQGELTDTSRKLIGLNSRGRTLKGITDYVLSASQIEAYLRCPYSWFVEKRLSLNDFQAEFGPLEIGTFVHKVLELCRSRAAKADLDLQNEADKAAIHELLDACFDEHLKAQLAASKHKKFDQLLIAHSLLEEDQLVQLKKELHSTLDFESQHFIGFKPAEFEFSFGREAPVLYAGVPVTGTIDRIDIDAHQNALILDYKHKKAGALASYSLANLYDKDKFNPKALPEHIQSLMYAQIVRRLRPDLKIVGSVYLSTSADNSKSEAHCIRGAVDENFIDLICGEKLSAKTRGAMVAPSELEREDSSAFYALLDHVEALVEQEIAGIAEANIKPAPRFGKKSCQACIVRSCEKRAYV